MGVEINHAQSHSQPRINRLTFQGQYAEDAFVYAVQRFSTDETFERLNAESELLERQRTLGP